MFAELLGKKAGYCKGKGGSMHIADPSTGNLGANAIVGGSAALATGAAYSCKTLGTDKVVVCFFGEGALGQGVLYEAMNMAKLWKLPVIYACENNMYNEYTHYSETTAGEILGRPAAFGIPGEEVDGQDVRAVYAAATKLVQKYQSSSCEQLAQERQAPKSAQKEQAKQRAGEMLRNDAQVRQEFVSKVAAPIVDKMIVCGFIP